MKCKNCGAELNDNAHFCPDCGTVITNTRGNQAAAKEYMDSTRRGRNFVLFIVFGVGVLILLFGAYVFSEKVGIAEKRIDKWPATGMAAMVDAPAGNSYDISLNTDDTLYAYAYKCSKEDYDAYVKSCKDRGFDVKPSGYDHSYSAFNEDGYSLDLYYNESKKMIDIDINEPREIKKLQWPGYGLSTLLPKPTDEMGSVNSDTDTYFNVTVYMDNEESYYTYVDECLKAGFNVDYHRSDSFFSGSNEDGCRLTVSYTESFVDYYSVSLVKDSE